MIVSWTAVAGCDAERMRGPTRPQEALKGVSQYCPEQLQQALRQQIPRSSFVSVDYCLCSDIPPCDLCEFSQQRATGVDGGPEQAAASQQQQQALASFGQVVCEVLADPQCCNCCAAFSAPSGPEQQPIK